MTPHLETEVAHLQALVDRLAACFAELIREVEHEPEPHPAVVVVRLLAGAYR